MSTATSTDIAVDIAVDSTYSKHDPISENFADDAHLDNLRKSTGNIS